MKTVRPIFFYLVLLGLGVLLIEVVSYTAYYILYSKSYDIDELEKSSRLILEATESGDNRKPRSGFEGPIAARVIHPYTGYVHEPGISRIRNLATGQRFSSEDCYLNKQGFLGDPELLTREAGVINVLIVGGSFANQFYCLGREKLVSLLKKNPEFRDEEFRFVGLAVGAFKQPQQLLALTYYLSLGGELDWVINIDGFNEIVNTQTVVKQNAHPAYPLHWEKLTSGVTSVRALKNLGVLTQYKGYRKDLAEVVSGALNSRTIGLFWSLTDNYLTRKIYQTNQEIDHIVAKKGYQFSTRGPEYDPINIANFAKDLWYRSSLQMRDIAETQGGKYFHFLQPNQYVPNSKIFTAYEKNNYVRMSSKASRQVRKGYPLLQESGKKLMTKGVLFNDISGVYKETENLVYIDTCCHVNGIGNEIVAAAIAKYIISNN